MPSLTLDKDISLGRTGTVSAAAFIISFLGSLLILGLMSSGSVPTGANLGEINAIFFVYVFWITIIAPSLAFILTEKLVLKRDEYDNKELGLALLIGAIPFTATVTSLSFQSSTPTTLLVIGLVAIWPGLQLLNLGLPFVLAFGIGAAIFSTTATLFALLIERKTDL